MGNITCSKRFNLTVGTTLNLKSYWKLDETGVNVRVDSRGTLNLTATGTVNNAAGIINNGASFTGTGSVPHLTGNSTGQLLTGPATIGFSMTAWVYLTNVTGGATLVAHSLISLDGGNSFSVAIRHDVIVTGPLHVTIVNSDNSITSTITLAALPSLNTWHFVRLWLDPADLKIRAKLDEGTTVVGAAAITGIVTPATMQVDFRKGSSYSNTPRIDEVGVWDGLLTDAQGTAIYNGGAGLAFGPGYPGT